MMTDVMRKEVGAPKVVDRTTFDAQLDALRVREKAHTHEGDAIAAARRRLPTRGAVKLLDVFERRRQLIAYYFMWHTGHPAPEQCEGCTCYHAGPRAVLSSLSRRHLRRVLPGAVRRERPLSRLYGLGDALVLGSRL